MKKLIFTSFLVLLCGWLVSVPARAVSIDFNPPSPYTQAGGTLSVDVVVSDLGDGIVTAFDLNVLYNSGWLTNPSVVFGSWLGDPGLWQVVNDYSIRATADPVVWVLNFSAVSYLSDADLKMLQQVAHGTPLATLNFEVLQSGATLDWGPDNMIVLAPEPGTVLLLAGGLLIGAFCRRLGRKAS